MSLAVFFDLDDTLIQNNMDRFLPAYIQALNNKFALAKPDLLPTALRSATMAMLQNQSPFRTLEEVFNEVFYPLINSRQEEHLSKVEEFYQQDFPHLQSVTQQIPEAEKILKECAARGYNIAIATNPLFPRTATMQRIGWAGIDVNNIPLSIISTFEEFHFSKPRIEYYLEMLCRMNWPDRAVMIGNDFADDILPAAQLGLPTYFISEEPIEYPLDCHPLSDQGPLTNVPIWMEIIDQSMKNISYSSPNVLVAALKATPAYIDSMSRKLPPESWHKRPIEDEWSLVEILCHLRDVDGELNLARISRILKQPGTFIRSEKIDDLAISRNYIAEDRLHAKEEYFSTRGKLIDLLSTLDPETWNTQARHSIYGPTKLIEIVELILAHDQAHTRQFGSTMVQVT